VEKATVQNSSTYVGDLDAREFATIRPRTSGQVEQVFMQLGDRVRAGEPILQIDAAQQQATFESRTASTAAAEAALSNARANLAASRAERLNQSAQLDYDREQQRRNLKLFAEGAISRDALDQSTRNIRQAEAALAAQEETIRAQEAALTRTERELESAQSDAEAQAVQLDYYQVKAPFDGVVGDIPVKVGDYVTPETSLTTLSQNTSLEVSINVPLERSPDIRAGTPVELLDRQNRTIAESEVSFVSPDVNAATQSVLVKAMFDNAEVENQLRSEQYVRARVIWSEKPSFVVPTTAVTRLGDQSFVFVATEQKGEAAEGEPQLVASQKPVQLGQMQKNHYEVVSGLKGDERIVLTGVQKIFDSSPIVSEAEASSSAPAAGGPSATE
jgi:RND family efflux transporter MFP subunit